MRKLLLILIIIFSSVVFLHGYGEDGNFQVQFNFGIDVKGCHDRIINTSGSEDKAVSMGLSPSIEFINQGRYFDIGVGFEYQLEREIENSNGARFNFMPIYTLFRLEIITTEARTLEAVTHLGYNFFDYNDKYIDDNFTTRGDFYWAAGLSLVLSHRIVLQSLYKENRATLDYQNHTSQIKNTCLSLSLGLRI